MNIDGLNSARRALIRVTVCLMLAGAVPSYAKDENVIAGKQVDPSAKISVGDKLVAYYEKKTYLVEVIEIQRDKKLKIRWIETKEETPDVRPDELYVVGESNQTRRSKASTLPETFRALDANKDGQIGLYEWERSKYAEFRRLDKNKDGFLTPQELAATAPAANAPKDGAAAKESAPKEAPANSKEPK